MKLKQTRSTRSFRNTWRTQKSCMSRFRTQSTTILWNGIEVCSQKSCTKSMKNMRSMFIRKTTCPVILKDTCVVVLALILRTQKIRKRQIDQHQGKKIQLMIGKSSKMSRYTLVRVAGTCIIESTENWLLQVCQISLTTALIPSISCMILNTLSCAQAWSELSMKSSSLKWFRKNITQK